MQFAHVGTTVTACDGIHFGAHGEVIGDSQFGRVKVRWENGDISDCERYAIRVVTLTDVCARILVGSVPGKCRGSVPKRPTF